MTKRKQPITSILAHNSIKESKSAMYAKIVEALEKLRVGGISEEIANMAELKHSQVWKRLSELRDMDVPVVYNVGTTRIGSSGRACMIWQLCSFKPKTQTGKAVQVDLFS